MVGKLKGYTVRTALLKKPMLTFVINELTEYNKILRVFQFINIATATVPYSTTAKGRMNGCKYPESTSCVRSMCFGHTQK
jgi:tRNA isopentenyl-2-thiomethyl-A-37 hydroxylase MiaE